MAEPTRTRVPVRVEAAGDTHIGGRSHNEDAILLRPDLNLYLVADGAGGQNAGNVAASLAISTIAHFFERTRSAADKLPERDGLGLPTSARRLSAAVQEANEEILAISKHSDRHKGMGTTVVASLLDVTHSKVHVAHVGDSRCYRLRDGRLELLTQDHSLINDVLELRPNISDERVKKLPQNVITRALGMMDNLRVSIRSYELVHGDRYLLCSDGLSDVVHEQQLNEVLSLDIECDQQVAILVNMALEAGSDDNVAVVVLDCSLPSGGGVQASTRPIKTSRKKASRPKMRRVEAPPPRVREETIPEIVLYEEPQDGDRESSPLVHVVPRESTTAEMVSAVADMMGREEIPRAPISSSSGGGRTTRDWVETDPRDDGRYAHVDDSRQTRPSAKSPMPASVRTQRGALPTKGAKGYSAPRIQKHPADFDDPRRGATRRPADSDTPSGPSSSPDPRLGGHTRQPPPLRKRAATPPMRHKLDTTDFTGEHSIVCHACGSIIAADAETCVYCGAMTGFVIKE
jgi:PPM family protein phosphatase